MGAVVSDPNGLTWAATLVSLAVAIPTAGHAVIFFEVMKGLTALSVSLAMFAFSPNRFAYFHYHIRGISP